MAASGEDPVAARKLFLLRLEQERPDDDEARAVLAKVKQDHLERTAQEIDAELGPNPTPEQVDAWLQARAERAQRELADVDEQQRRFRDRRPQ
jgi:hypothetical protein